MFAQIVDKIAGLVGTLMVSAFVIGLAESISSGFAGFWGGLPFWCLSIPILGLAFFDFFDTCIRKKDPISIRKKY
tara:strand:- start:91 stop:315 length:225 start_codon:yes stop_codon:yes gene_type:complete